MNKEQDYKKLRLATEVLERALNGKPPYPSWASVLEAVELFQANPQEKVVKAFLVTIAQLKGRLAIDYSETKSDLKTAEEILIEKAKETIKQHYKDTVIFTNLVVFEKGVRSRARWKLAKRNTLKPFSCGSPSVISVLFFRCRNLTLLRLSHEFQNPLSVR